MNKLTIISQIGFMACWIGIAILCSKDFDFKSYVIWIMAIVIVVYKILILFVLKKVSEEKNKEPINIYGDTE